MPLFNWIFALSSERRKQIHIINEKSASVFKEVVPTGLEGSIQNQHTTESVIIEVENTQYGSNQVAVEQNGQSKRRDSVVDMEIESPSTPSYLPPLTHMLESQSQFEEKIGGTTHKFAPKPQNQIPQFIGEAKEFSASLPEPSRSPPRPPTSGSTTTKAKPTLKSRKISANSTVIFENPSTTPITIVLTAPEGEYPLRLPKPTAAQLEARFGPKRNNHLNMFRGTRLAAMPFSSTEPLSDTSTANLTKLPQKRLDHSRLIPPSGHELDTRRIKKAREIQEIRSFMVRFLSLKGHKLPEKLRLRILDLYVIRDSDLAPEVIARWNTYEDNTVEILGDDLNLEKAGSYQDQMRLLEKAFRSQIPDITPRVDEFQDSPPPFQPRRISSTRRPHTATAPLSRRLTLIEESSDTPQVFVPKSETFRRSISNPEFRKSFYLQNNGLTNVSVNSVATGLSYNTMGTSTTDSIMSFEKTGGGRRSRRNSILGFLSWKKPRVDSMRRSVIY